VTCHFDPLICKVDSATPQLAKTRSRKLGASRGGEKKLETRSHCLFSDILYINSLRLSVSQSVSDGGFGGGGGRGRWSSGRPVSVCEGGWTTTVSVYKPSSQNIVAVRRVGMMVGSHPSPTAPEADIKTFPSPLPPLPKEPAII